MKVYVAASSNETERAEQWIDALRRAGVEVTSTWVEEVKAHGGGNPPGASTKERQQWARDDLYGVESADILWVLVPKDKSHGAFTELGYALRANKDVITSGPASPPSIFLDLTEQHKTDLEAYTSILVKVGVIDVRKARAIGSSWDGTGVFRDLG